MPTTPLTLDQIICLARKHVTDDDIAMRSSAVLCLSDAVLERCYEHYPEARRRAVKSLAYSVGMFHEDYKAAQV